MAVRIQTEITSLGASERTRAVAVANSGYETRRPELLLPAGLASLLGVYPQLPPRARTKTYSTAGGAVRVYTIPNYGKVRLLLAGKRFRPVVCSLVISKLEDEALLSDALMSSLGIMILDAKKGSWRHRRDSSRTRRRSRRPQRW